MTPNPDPDHRPETPKPDFPDRTARVGADGMIERILHTGSTVTEGQRIETIRTWSVGADGKTDIEREYEMLAAENRRLREALDGIKRYPLTAAWVKRLVDQAIRKDRM